MNSSQLDHATLTEAVRTAVRHRLGERMTETDATYSETVLLREGNYCGRCFRWGGWAAIWTLDAGEIRFFDADRRLIESLPAPTDSDETTAAPLRKVGVAA